MKIKWTVEFDVPGVPEPVVRDQSRWLHNKLVEVTGLNFTNGVLEMVVCRASDSTRSHSPVVYRPENGYGEVALDVIPDRAELDKILPALYARAKAEVLVNAAERAGMPNALTDVRCMLKCQEEFIRGVNDIYAALRQIEAERARDKATEAK